MGQAFARIGGQVKIIGAAQGKEQERKNSTVQLIHIKCELLEAATLFFSHVLPP